MWGAVVDVRSCHVSGVRCDMSCVVDVRSGASPVQRV